MSQNPTLEQFEAAFRWLNDAFNRGDLETAFAGLAPDCEWHLFEEHPAHEVLVGPEQVRRWFERELFDLFPGLRNEPVRFQEAGDGVFIVLSRWHGGGRGSGVPTDLAHAAIWELRDGVPVRVREFSSWEAALEAAGLDSLQA